MEQLDLSEILSKKEKFFISNLVEQIAEDCIFSKLQISGINSGRSGTLLLLGYLSKINDTKYRSQLLNEYLQVINDLDDVSNSYTLSNGIAGIAFSLSHIGELCNINILLPEHYKKVDIFLDKMLNFSIKENNWDPLHGYIGIGLYYLSKKNNLDYNNQISTIIQALYSSRQNYKGNKTWITPGFLDSSKDHINFGMAHGVPGIVSFLAHAARIGIQKEICKEMIEDSFSLFESFKNKEIRESSIYPSAINLKDNSIDCYSRLAWCYGDLGIGNAYFHASITFDNIEWFNKGNEIFVKATNRNINTIGILDASFCHGSIGIIHQFYRCYRLKKSPIIKNYILTLLKMTLSSLYKPGEGIGGFQYSSYNDFIKERELLGVVGLLEGSTGIALVLLCLVYNIEPSWDIIYQTNI